MGNVLSVHTHSTSGVNAMPFSRQQPLTYPATSVKVGHSQTLVTELTDSQFPNHRLFCPITASVSWSQEMGCYLAVDYVFQWHGQGESGQEALQDLADIIAEDYEDLQNWPGELSRPLQDRLTIIKRYFEDAR